MAYLIAPVINGNTFVTANGKTLQGKVFGHVAGSFTVPAPLFLDQNGTPAPNPIELNSGAALPVNIYLETGVAYNLVIRGSDDEVFLYVDNLIVGDQ